MIVQCSKCKTSFNVDQSLISESAKVFYCSLCKNEWAIEFKENIDSVGVNYVLHCVPGKLENKIDIMLKNLKNDKKEKTFFGATVLFDKNLQSNLSNFELFFLNKYGIFNNNLDNGENLINYFEKNRIDYSYKIIGNVIIFDFKN